MVLPLISLDNGIELRIFGNEEAEVYFKLVDRHRDILREWQGWVAHTNNVEDSRRYLTDSVSQMEDEVGVFWGIWNKNRLMGVVCLNTIDWENYRAEVGYWLAPPYWGAGYMTQALQRVISYSFEELELHRLEAFTIEANQPSWQVLERCEFVCEGMMRDGAFVRGAFWDVKMYGRINNK